MRRIIAVTIAATALANSADAQTLFGVSARIAPQFVSYTFPKPIDRSISEFAFPIAVVVPVTERINVDLSTAFATSTVKGGTSESKISGLTDTQLRANFTLGNDAVVITAGLNLPTGQSTVSRSEQDAAAAISDDFLVFPVATLGTGLAATGGVAFARSMGSWNLGLGASMRQSSAFEPFEKQDTFPQVRFQPGNEYRARAGVDRTVGSGRLAFGLTYSSFGRDRAGSFTYSTGNRIIPQMSYVRPLGKGDLVVAFWDLYRGKGKSLDTIPVKSENILNLAVSTSFPGGGFLLEPNVELRHWTQEGTRAGTMGVFGVRVRRNVGVLAVIPSVGFSVGSLQFEERSGTPTVTTTQSVSFTGFRGALTIRYVP